MAGKKAYKSRTQVIEISSNLISNIVTQYLEKTFAVFIEKFYRNNNSAVTKL